LSQFTRLTDGRTDRRTDGILVARPHLHSMQRGKKLGDNLIHFLCNLLTNVKHYVRISSIRQRQFHPSSYLLLDRT